MNSMQEKFAKIKSIMAKAEEDLQKFTEKGNKTAGVRLRKSLQDVKDIAQDIRKEILNTRK